MTPATSFLAGLIVVGTASASSLPIGGYHRDEGFFYAFVCLTIFAGLLGLNMASGNYTFDKPAL